MESHQTMLALFVLVVAASITAACPQGCACDMKKQEVTCSGLNMLPHSVPSDMLSFRCVGCLLFSIRAQDLDGMKHIEKLYLSSARIATIDPYAFSALQNLQILDLAGNGIKILDASSFVGLDRLKQLILHSNEIADIVSVFDPLPSLEYLILHSNNFRIIPKGVFQNMNNLKSMRLDWNQIEEIHPYSFAGLSSLSDLNLLANKIHTLHDGAFESLGNLKQVYLGRNQLTGFDPAIFQPLVSLEHLNFFQNKIATFQPHQFDALPNVREIVAQNNGLNHIAPSAFKGLASLKSLGVGNNNIKRLFKSMLEGLDNLETLDLVNVNLESIDKDAFMSVRNLLFLHLYNNPKLNIKDGSIFNAMRQLKKIMMQRTALTQVPANMDLPELDQIEMGENFITTLPKDLGLSSSTKLRYVGLNDNSITEINLTHLSNFKMIENLRLQNNKIVTLDESLRPIFDNNLKHVRIDGNLLHCNCEVSWLKTITHNKFYGRQGGYNLRCATPHTKYLLRETSPDDFKCIKPRFITDRTHLKSTSSDDLTLTCTAYGDPAPKLSWEVVSETSNGLVRSVYKKALSSTKHASFESVDTLSLKKSTLPSTYKEFVCVAENRVGRVENKFSV